MSHHKNIFIVEDNEVFSLMLDYTLSQDTPYRFVRFRTGEECLENLHLEPDLVILDYGLPGMNGYETLKEIEKRRPNTHVLVFTNNKDARLEEQVKKAGADDLLLKQDRGEMQVAQRIRQILAAEDQGTEKNLRVGIGTMIAGAALLLLIAVLVSISIFS
jgi:DNA-binding NarL/FixJ family response regulator